MRTKKESVVLFWSGGKDCALALHEISKHETYQVILLTTVTEEFDRVGMHGVREELLEAQVRSLGLTVEKVRIPPACSDTEYEARTETSLTRLKELGCRRCFFGDLFLEDVRAYRENILARLGLVAEFPLWGRDRRKLAEEFIQGGWKAVIVCVDTQALDGSFSGAEYDSEFVGSLSRGVDVCGENGEFHTFVYDGPDFASPVRFQRGEVVLREGRFSYCDLSLA